MTKATMRAFAAGIILSVSLMASVYFLDSRSQVTIEEAEKLLKAEGFQVTKNQTTAVPRTEPEQPPKQEEKPVPQQGAGDSDNETAGDEETSKEPQVAKESGKTVDTNNAGNPAAYNLKINYGMTTRDIAILLEEHNILADAELFEGYMNENQLSTRIQVGEFPLVSGMTHAQIAGLITRK